MNKLLFLSLMSFFIYANAYQTRYETLNTIKLSQCENGQGISVELIKGSFAISIEEKNAISDSVSEHWQFVDCSSPLELISYNQDTNFADGICRKIWAFKDKTAKTSNNYSITFARLANGSNTCKEIKTITIDAYLVPNPNPPRIGF